MHRRARACGPGAGGLPELPRINNVRVIQRGDTAIVEFEPVAGARRLPHLPAAEAGATCWSARTASSRSRTRSTAAAAIARSRRARTTDGFMYGASFTGGQSGNLSTTTCAPKPTRCSATSTSTPGPGRVPVYRWPIPNGGGGFRNADWVVPLYGGSEPRRLRGRQRGARRLVAAGWRDDGIAFYVPEARARAPVYRKVYDGATGTARVSRLLHRRRRVRRAPGRRARTDVVDFGERFKILASQEPDTRPAAPRALYGATFDVLAAGEARYQRVLQQGNQPSGR